MSSIMTGSRSPTQNCKSFEFKTTAKLISIEVLGILVFIIGIILLCLYTEKNGYEIVEDYTDCQDLYLPTRKCKDSLKTKNEPCYCDITINIRQPMDAVVTVYYELESYDFSSYTTSRDDKQLTGDLSSTPSSSCDPYTFLDGKPIAPCGALADAMFNDTFKLQTNNSYIPKIQTGLISESDKAPFHNPPGNLEKAFKNFSKPKNWVKNVWELDTTNADNNGFQNEAFIAWMKTDWKRKPSWRINHTNVYEHGVPAGLYILRVQYAYPPSRYDGRRKVIISSIHYVINSHTLGFGIALLIIGFTVFIGKLLYNRKKYGSYNPCSQKVPFDQ